MHARHCGIIGRLALTGLLGWAFGCDRPSPPAPYSMLAGRVRESRPETGELTVEVRGPAPGRPAVEICNLTKDSEIYINDRFSSIDQIQVGDAVELLGYRDPNPRLERFVVSFAYVDHPQPPPPAPELAAPAAAAPIPPEEQ